MNTRTIAMIVLSLSTVAAAGCDRDEKASDVSESPAKNASNTVAIRVGADGFQPSSVRAEKGEPLTLRFTRTTDATCAKNVEFPELGIKKELPLEEPVAVRIPTGEARKLTFQCGMGMYESSVVIN